MHHFLLGSKILTRVALGTNFTVEVSFALRESDNILGRMDSVMKKLSCVELPRGEAGVVSVLDLNSYLLDKVGAAMTELQDKPRPATMTLCSQSPPCKIINEFEFR